MIDALCEMNNKGVWVFGSVIDDERGKGMGAVVEYGPARPCLNALVIDHRGETQTPLLFISQSASISSPGGGKRVSLGETGEGIAVHPRGR